MYIAANTSAGSDRRKLMSRQLKHNHDTALESVGGKAPQQMHAEQPSKFQTAGNMHRCVARTYWE